MAVRVLRPRVAIIDNSIYPEIYRPVEDWGRYLPIRWETFVARDHRFPKIARFTHLILTGSEASILEPDAWVAEEAECVREAVERGLSVLGSCWGHQLLASALAGPGHVARCARPEVGWIPIRLTADSELLGAAGEEPYTFTLHFDEVRSLPLSFEVLAATDLCPVQAMRLAGRPVWGVQCHPEMDVPTGLRFLRDLVEAGFKGRESLLAALAAPPRDSGLVRRIVACFLGRPAARP